MRKPILSFAVLTFMFFNLNAAEELPPSNFDGEPTYKIIEPENLFEIQNLNLPDANKINENPEKGTESKYNRLLKKSTAIFNKDNIFSGADFYIGAFILGFFLGPIGILLVYLFNLKQPNRKAKVMASLLGWTWWLLILSIILLI